MKCTKCNHYHRELPSTLVPYKRLVLSTVQTFIERGNTDNLGCETSTPYKILGWFKALLGAFILAIKVRMRLFSLPDDDPSIDSMEKLLARPKWLTWLCLTLCNYNKWPRPYYTHFFKTT